MSGPSIIIDRDKMSSIIGIHWWEWLTICNSLPLPLLNREQPSSITPYCDFPLPGHSPKGMCRCHEATMERTFGVCHEPCAACRRVTTLWNQSLCRISGGSSLTNLGHPGPTAQNPKNSLPYLTETKYHGHCRTHWTQNWTHCLSA